MAADYAAAAAVLAKRGDKRAAIEQLAAALTLCPLDDELHKQLYDIVASTRGPLRLVAIPPREAFFGLCAVRGEVLWRVGRVAEGFDCLCQAARRRPPDFGWIVELLVGCRRRTAGGRVAAATGDATSPMVEQSIGARKRPSRAPRPRGRAVTDGVDPVSRTG